MYHFITPLAYRYIRIPLQLCIHFQGLFSRIWEWTEEGFFGQGFPAAVSQVCSVAVHADHGLAY